MSDDGTQVLYNEDCPVCRYEITHYRSYSNKLCLPIHYQDLNTTSLDHWGVSKEQAAKRLHVIKNGVLYSGIPAFVILWQDMPRFRWIARVVGLPVIKQFCIFTYDWVLAPILYALHKRRLQKSAASK